MDETDPNDADPCTLNVKIRQSFYKGMARECLEQAWLRLNDFRDQKTDVRLFRGRVRERRGISLFQLAKQLKRSTGELNRWFHGSSPEWSNLLMVMTALDVDWLALQPIAEKKYRKTSGCMAALRFIRRTRFAKPGREDEPSHHVVTCLEAVFADDTWEVDRRIERRRLESLERISRQSKISVHQLNAADSEWGDAYRIWARFYADAMDEELWT